jgi:hypothetical protein
MASTTALPTVLASANFLDRDLLGEKLALGVLAAYAVTLGLCCQWGRSHFAMTQPREREAAGIAACVLLASLLPRAFRMLTKPRTRGTGVTALMLSVHVVSLLSNWLMYLGPMPIVVDHVTHTRNHMARWAEWTVLSFAMIFAVEAVDAESLAWPVRMGTLSGVSTACGIALPFIRSKGLWGAVLAFSFVTYLAIFPRLVHKLHALANVPDSGLITHAERKVRLGVACRLLTSCCAIWSIFVANYFVAWMGQAVHSGGSGLGYPEWPFVLDCFIDVFSKLVYGDIVDEENMAAPLLFEQEQVRPCGRAGGGLSRHRARRSAGARARGGMSRSALALTPPV